MSLTDHYRESFLIPSPAVQTRLGLTLLRGAAAGTMVIHGIVRVVDGGVTGFGGFLGANGFPLGVAIAWMITIVEIAGGLTLLSGRLVRPLAGWFIGEHIMGITLVHARNGWFVVGLGRNGMEYSVLLIICFVVIALTHAPKTSSEAD